MSHEPNSFGFTWEASDAYLEHNVGYLSGEDAYVTVFLKDGRSVNVWIDGTVEFMDEHNMPVVAIEYKDGNWEF